MESLEVAGVLLLKQPEGWTPTGPSNGIVNDSWMHTLPITVREVPYLREAERSAVASSEMAASSSRNGALIVTPAAACRSCGSVPSSVC